MSRIEHRQDELKLALGRVLRSLRLGKSLAQDELAHRAGLDRTYISMLERGQKSPTVSTLVLICDVLDVSPSGLLKLAEDQIGKD